jgi:hypothetical protein
MNRVEVTGKYLRHHSAALAHYVSAFLHHGIYVGLATPAIVNASVSGPLLYRMACPFLFLERVDYPAMSKALLAFATSPRTEGMASMSVTSLRSSGVCQSRIFLPAGGVDWQLSIRVEE